MQGHLLSALIAAPNLDPSLSPGTDIGVWRLERFIGCGGMSEVYLARRADPEFEQIVALKVIAAGLASIEQFRDERRILGRLKDPGIATLIDGGELADGRMWFAMEYVDGVPIDVFVNSNAIGWTQRIEICEQLCAAIEHAHSHLLVHRDIKPGNVLVDRQGRPRLIDFGIAVTLQGSERSQDHLMTPGFAAPEQLTGGAITTATDIYQLGRMLGDLLLPTGRHGASLPTLPRPVALRDMQSVVARATAHEPQRRHANVSALASDLAAVREHRPVAAKRAPFFYRAQLFSLRHQWATALATVAAIAGAIGGFMLVQSVARENHERAEALREEQTATAIGSFFVELFNEPAQPNGDSGGTADAGISALLDRGQRRLLARERRNPEIDAALLHTLAQVNMQMERTDMARTMFEEAAMVKRSNGEPESLALTLASLAYINALSGAEEAGEVLAREAEGLLETNGRNEGRTRLLALTQLAQYYNVTFEFGLSDRTLEEAIRAGTARYGADSPEFFHARRLQVNSLQYRWLVDAALPLSEQLSRRCASAFGADDAVCLIDLIHLQRMRGLSGDLAGAESVYLSLLAQKDEWEGLMRHYRVHAILFGLAELRSIQGRWPEARQIMDEALVELARSQGKTGSHWVSDRGALALLLLDMGDIDGTLQISSESQGESALSETSLEWSFWTQRQARIELAAGRLDRQRRSDLQRALAALEKTYGVDSYFAAKTRATLGMIEAHEGNITQARDLLESAARSRSQGLHYFHPQLLAEIDSALAAIDDNPDSAYRRLQSAESRLRKVYGADHPLTAAATIATAEHAAKIGQPWSRDTVLAMRNRLIAVQVANSPTISRADALLLKAR